MQTPISRQHLADYRGSNNESPFKLLSTFNQYSHNQDNEDPYNEMGDDYFPGPNRTIAPYFDDHRYTAGLMFCENNASPPPQPKESNQELRRCSACLNKSTTKRSRILDISRTPVRSPHSAFHRRDEDTNGRCSRGLKVLSVKVRDIVHQKRETSYKEVAESLISDASFDQGHLGATVPPAYKKNKKKKAREEQNVKRRVYDALNVLIAAEVLRKSAKIVSFNETGRRRVK